MYNRILRLRDERYNKFKILTHMSVTTLDSEQRNNG